MVPPVGPCPSTGCSVLLATHGAGVEAGSPAWTGAIPQMNNLWVGIFFAVNTFIILLLASIPHWKEILGMSRQLYSN